MTKATRQILSSFERLSEAEKRTVAREIVRRSARLNWSPLADSELVQAADTLFLELDQGESV